MTSGEAGGGGILRDHEGKMCWAFARAYHGLKSSLAVEALALRDGLSICCGKGFTEGLFLPSSCKDRAILTSLTVRPVMYQQVIEAQSADPDLAEILQMPEVELDEDSEPPSAESSDISGRCLLKAMG
ncbi:hypothetical protein Taro_044631 [Colocasia esculenta]|uniref:RNase H type-1 domain-containing protein n=1 Tax=Colocasia esculenta TaxID=4460 RepID=A0A843X175_COLES|nr:hypothetical protein [Colocasia esculenta]